MRNVFLGAVFALFGGYLFRLLEARNRLTNSIRLLIAELEMIMDNLAEKRPDDLRPLFERSVQDYRMLIRDLDPVKFEEHCTLFREVYEATHFRNGSKGTLNLLIRVRYLLRVASRRPGDAELGPPPYREDIGGPALVDWRGRTDRNERRGDDARGGGYPGSGSLPS